MNESYFQSGIYGEPRYLPDEQTRARWVAADALRELAKGEERSMAAKIRNIAGKIEAGNHPSKKGMNAIGQKRIHLACLIFIRLCRERVKVPLIMDSKSK